MAVINHHQVSNFQNNITELWRVFVDRQIHLATHHQRCKVAHRGFGRHRVDDFASSNNGHDVSNSLDFAKLVSDEHNRGSLVSQLAHNRHELICLLRRQYGSWLIQNEDFCLTRKGFHDFHALLNAHRQIFDGGIGVDIKTETSGNLSHPLAGSGQV